MDPVKLPPGYLLPDEMTMKDVLRIDAEILASEGIDPEWGFGAPRGRGARFRLTPPSLTRGPSVLCLRMPRRSRTARRRLSTWPSYGN
jgi:hypothetical protein